MNRDIRFSKDKTPYMTSAGTYSQLLNLRMEVTRG